MGIQTYISVGVPDIDRLAKSKGFNFNPVYITVSSCIYGQVFPVRRSDIETHMIMIGPQFPEICSEADGNIQRVSELILRIGEWLEKLTGSDPAL